MFKRVGGWVMVVLALLTFLLMVASIFGTWFGKRSVDMGAEALLTTSADYLGLAITGLASVDASLASAEVSAQRLANSAQAVAAQGENPTAVALQKTVGEDIRAGMAQTEALVTSTLYALESFNSTLVTVNRLPGVDVPTFSTQLETAAAKLQSVSDAMTSVSERVAAGDGAAALAATARLVDDIEATRAQLNESSQMVATTQAQLLELSDNLPFYTTLGAVSLTVLLALLAWGQWALWGAAWGWAHGRSGRQRAVSA